MTTALARGVMALAQQCLGADRREWARAMQAEFEVARDDGKPLSFAIGCLLTAGAQMVQHGEGRRTLAGYAMALSLLVPMALLYFRQALGLARLAAHAALLGPGDNPYLVWSQNSAVPVLLILWMVLGLAHLCLAWDLLEGDWASVLKLGTAIGAATITLVLLASLLMLDLSPLLAQMPALAVEGAMLLAVARWHTRPSRAASAGALPG
ncbi:hypothetical protein [Sphingomonas azotifigens]|uniref:hypothetical protein n=1 Tax=Sphingomonas azotifigens TaxID=330920 RepID=UPI0009FCB96D|nr:hypothetical protein [Sphingomonas azotifigens]